jgi:hypothetical protein
MRVQEFRENETGQVKYMITPTLDEEKELCKMYGPGGTGAQTIEAYLKTLLNQTCGGDVLSLIADVTTFDPDRGSVCPLCGCELESD